MKKLRRAMEYCTEKELEMANEEFPMFFTDHEGVAITEEEVYEAEVEMQRVIEAFNTLKYERVFGDMSDAEKKDVAEALKKTAQNLACESIQVAAMAQKFIDSMERRREEHIPEFTQEHADFLAKMTNEEKDNFIVKRPTFLNEEIKDKLADIVKAFEGVK